MSEPINLVTSDEDEGEEQLNAFMMFSNQPALKLNAAQPQAPEHKAEQAKLEDEEKAKKTKATKEEAEGGGKQRDGRSADRKRKKKSREDGSYKGRGKAKAEEVEEDGPIALQRPQREVRPPDFLILGESNPQNTPSLFPVV